MSEIQQADLFEIPLLDGSAGLGQVIEAADNRLFVLVSSKRRSDADAVPVPLSDVLGLFPVDPAPLTSGQWAVFGFDMIPKTRQLLDHDAVWQDGPATDPALVEAFLNACWGLFPWDGFPDPETFDRMLAPGRDRPWRAKMAEGFGDS